MQIINSWGLVICIAVLVSATNCKPEPDPGQADMLLVHAMVYPVRGNPIEDGAVVIRNGKIVALGRTADLDPVWNKHVNERKDCEGRFLMPGFIEGHGHFSSLGENLIQLDLLDTHSWQEIVDSVAVRAAKARPGEWIVGRGWHQEKWNQPVVPNVLGYPYNDSLSAVSPHNPVMLIHASGHSLIANREAVEIAGINRETPNPAGGVIVRDAQRNAIGVFEENAQHLIEDMYNAYKSSLTDAERWSEWNIAIEKAEAHCLSYGITSFQDMGSSIEEVHRYEQLAKEGKLDLRLYAMIHQPLDELKGHLEGIPILHAGDDRFTCRGIKAYMDGALGSYGAWLLKPYEDRPGYSGQFVTPVKDLEAIADFCIANQLQLATHAIGDRANRTVLDVYEKAMRKDSTHHELRWRIEHAQHIDTADLKRFAELSVIASMQAIHCTSDAPFVVKRLGEERARLSAYPWRSLIDAKGVIALGTDAPVERVDPIPNFYAAVTRKRTDTGEAFFPEQCMSRIEAIYAMTAANAYAAFEEKTKGSLAPGKWADIVLLSNNLLNCPEDSILHTKVIWTMVGGRIVYESGQ